MSRGAEQRHFTRLPIRLEVQVSDGRRTLITGKTRDVGLDNLFHVRNLVQYNMWMLGEGGKP